MKFLNTSCRKSKKKNKQAQLHSSSMKTHNQAKSKKSNKSEM